MKAEEKRLKRLFASAVGGSWGAEPGESDIDALCIRGTDFDTARLRVETSRAPVRGFTAEDIRSRGAVSGDLIIEKSGGGEQQPVGRTVLWDGTDVVMPTNFAARLRVNAHTNARFATYLMASMWSDGRTRAAIKQTTGIQNLDLTSLLDQRISCPPVAIQRGIADYLDRETARIDALIAAKRRMVELLDQQVHSYVDRAIRDEARSKVSPVVTVIGGVRADWEVMHLRRVASIYSGTTFPHDYQGRSEGDYPLYKVADLASPGNETLLLNCGNWVSRYDLQHLRGRIVPPDSIVFPRVGAALLLNARRITTRPSLVDDNSRALHFARGDIRYWRYLMTLIDFGRLANPGAVPTIGEEAILSLKVPVPPDEVQHQIADAIDSHCLHCEKLRDASFRQTNLLQERRQALITAAVTGQLDIPEAA
jgi:type I restriction enzyme S subunit